MLQRFLQHTNTQKFLGWFIAFYIKVCFNTSLWYLKNEKEVLSKLKKRKKIIVIFWHNRLLMASFCWNYDNNFKMLISSHRDGQLISNAVSHLGIETIRGSSNKNKMSSVKEILKNLKSSNVVGITPDGPRGPREKIKDGIISLIRKTDATVIPLSYSAKFKIKINSWDKFIFVTPFNKFVAVWGNALKYNVKKNPEENLKIIESELKRVTKLSENLSK
tara:strand:- start:1039 stop:1695 length:657 start_codon:yes stop_codon:yes gene_type:complete